MRPFEAFRCLATHLAILWPMLGPTVTRAYTVRWSSRAGAKVLNLDSAGNLLEGYLKSDVDLRADIYFDFLQLLQFDDNKIDYISC